MQRRRLFNDRIEQLIATQPPVTEFPPQVIRDARESGASFFGPLVRVDWATERRIPGPAGRSSSDSFVPETVRGVFCTSTAADFMLGRAHHQDLPWRPLLRRHRSRPQRRLPAGPRRSIPGGAGRLRGRRRVGGGARGARVRYDAPADRGESAGANLAAVTLLRMRDRHRFTGFSGAVLTFGVFDISMTPSARRWGAAI